MRELRLGHVEAGYEISSALAYRFKTCKASIERGIGPAKKAEELKPEQIVMDKEPDEKQVENDDVVRPRRSWTVATGWLLREIELANLKVFNVCIEGENVGGLRLPVSKCDTHGAGIG
eukprot:9090631-Heterocapsa_arctica.AAC.1